MAVQMNTGGAARRERCLLVLSGKTRRGLEGLREALIRHLRSHSAPELDDLAYTCQMRHSQDRHRIAIVAASREDALRLLEGRDSQEALTGVAPAEERSVAFLLPGMGHQYTNMGLGLLQTEPTYREAFNTCCDLLRPMLHLDLEDIVFAPEQSRSESPPQRAGLDFRRMVLGRGPSESDRRLNEPRHAHSALFAVEYATAKLLESWGVRPKAMLGYSLGEYVAACLAGVLGVEEALELLVARARALEDLDAGGMLAVPLTEVALRSELPPEVHIAAVNGPEMCVAAGPEPAIESLERRLSERVLACRRLAASRAFHTPAMRPAKQRVRKAAASIRFRPPAIPYLSNLTGTWIRPEKPPDAAYWAEHMCRPVRFADGLRALWRDGSWIPVEVGPGRSLTSLALQHPAGREAGDRAVVSIMREAYETIDDRDALLAGVASLWIAGAPIDWQELWGRETRNVVDLSLRDSIEAPVSADSETAPAPRRVPTPFVAPETPLEKAICSVWRRILGVDDIGIHDAFLALGGHSMNAVQVVNELNRLYRIELPIDTLFRYPTVAEVALLMEERLLTRIESMQEEETAQLLLTSRSSEGTFHAD